MGEMNTYKGVKILYEDNHLLVVIKPPNMLSQADKTKDPDLLSLLKEYVKVSRQKPGNVYLGLVHRLDRPVGGVMVFAKTSKAASRLSEQIRERVFEKTYLAVVRGAPNPQKGTLKNYLAKDEARNMVYEVNEGDKRGSLAVLDYEVLNSTDGSSLVKINLHTGRPHQIRAQMALAGHPIHGDQKYGQSVNNASKHLMLWSAALAFIHPVKGERVEFTSNIGDGSVEGTDLTF
jgi:23S rRNA pseudouridine1911/1915/1917 synthase